jgi:hypothetical protein
VVGGRSPGECVKKLKIFFFQKLKFKNANCNTRIVLNVLKCGVIQTLLRRLIALDKKSRTGKIRCFNSIVVVLPVGRFEKSLRSTAIGLSHVCMYV